MRTGASIALEQRKELPQFEDGFFRTATSDGHFRVVSAPNMPRPVPDMLSSLQRLDNPILSLARAGANNVSIACMAVDLFNETEETLSLFKQWHIKSSVLVRHLGKGQC